MVDKPALSQDPRLLAALEAARATPREDSTWDALEQVAGALQRPDEVAALFREVLARDLPAEVATRIGLRAVRFHDEWFGGEDERLVETLMRVLAASPAEETALGRLTVILTVDGRWDDLLGVYDRAIAASPDADQRARLLEEALQVAKDFAKNADRAIGYLAALGRVRGGDVKLQASLEKMLEAQGRWGDLVAHWREAVPKLPAAQSAAARVRIAATILDRLGDASAAFDEARALLDDGIAEAAPLLERIAALTAAPAAVRLGAARHLAAWHRDAGRAAEQARVLDAAIAFAPADEVRRLHDEIAEVLSESGGDAGALEHALAVLVADPASTEAHERARELAQRAGAHGRYVEGLLASAERATPTRRAAVWTEAADVRASTLNDAAGAIALYARVLDSEGTDAGLSLRVARRLTDLLGDAGRTDEQLDVLERQATLEPSVVVKSGLVGQAAQLAERLGQADRAERLWRTRLELDGEDLEAIDALLALSERQGRWDTLVEVLRQRRAVPRARRERRADLVRIARVHDEKLGAIEPAIGAWLELAREFGEDAEVVDALGDLYARAERWADLAELFIRAHPRETAHVAGVFARLGDVQRLHLDSRALAATSYRRALDHDPWHDGARAGLRALLGDDATRPVAAEALARIYETTDEWQGLVELVEPRIVDAAPAAAVRILREAATILEARGADAASALTMVARALPLAPHDTGLEAELVRLAEATGAPAVAVQSLEEAAGAAATAADAGPARAAHLYRRAALLSETALGDARRALAGELAAAALVAPERHGAARIVRIAARAERWDEAAKALLASAARSGDLDEAALAQLDAAATTAGAADALADALEGAAERDELAPHTARLVELHLADWHASVRGDLERAAAALARAIRIAPDAAALRRLTEAQRTLAERGARASAPPGAAAASLRPLFDSLLALADRSPFDLDPLREAAEIAEEAGVDATRVAAVARRLFDESAALLRSGRDATGTNTAHDAATWALDAVVERARAAGHHDEVVARLVEAAHLPLEPHEQRALLHRAAEVAGEQLGDARRATELYREILDAEPTDDRAMQALARLYADAERLGELLTLRRHELGLAQNRTRRLELRLEIARLVGVIEERGGRVEALLANLEEAPGHEASIEELCAVLAQKGRQGGLADLLAEQARRVQALPDAVGAAKLWSRVALLSERDLGDAIRAMTAHKHTVELLATLPPGGDGERLLLDESLDALARLAEGLGEWAAAARWLERRLETATGEAMPATALRLAKAHVEAGQAGRAIACLERALLKSPDATRLADMLAELYRGAEAWGPLAKLLAEAAARGTDPAAVLAVAREAAGLYRDQLGTPERAIGVLERALALAPEDRWVKSSLADGLRVAGRLDEARTLLEGLVADFGRRRSPERAAVHLELARVLRAQGNLDEALGQLELASSMKVGDTAALALVGEVAREAGQLDRAEQAYRALLLAVRRQLSDAPEAVGPSEVLYALAKIAAAQGEKAESDELLASAVQTAAQSAVEVRRFRRAAAAAGDAELAARALEARLAFEQGEAQAALRVALAEVLESPLGRFDEALRARLAALDGLPESTELHRATRALAKKLGRTDDYLAKVQELVDGRRRTEEARLSSTLLLRLGEAQENDLGDLAAATELYQRVESMGELVVEAKNALARIAGLRGVPVEQRKRLEEIVAMDGASAEDQVDALYRLADIDLPNAEGRARGLEWLNAALERDPQYERAARVLRDAVSSAPDEVELWGLYQRVARMSGEDRMLLDYLERRAGHPEVTLHELKEGIELAERLGEALRREALLERTAARARELPGGLAEALWAPLALAARRREVGDPLGAIRWLREAALVAEADQARELDLEAARLAADEGGDATLAIQIYEGLLERDPTDASVWRPLLAVLRRQGDWARQRTVVRTTLDALTEPAARNALRLEQARFLLAAGDAAPDSAEDAVEILRDALIEDPDQADAALLLADLYERRGDRDGLEELLTRQLDAAKDRADTAAIGALSLRIASLISDARRDDALDVLRAALEWVPEHRAVLTVLLGLLGDDDDPRERAQRMEQLLTLEKGPAAADLARRLVASWKSLDDDDGVLRALEGGYRAAPEDDDLRERLATWYEAHEDWAGLARLWAAEGGRVANAATAVELLRQAATLQLDRLGDPAAAAATLGRALERAPGDFELLVSLCAAHRAAGDGRRAVDELGVALDRPMPDAQAVRLLHLRAELLEEAGAQTEAVVELERAFALGGAAAAPPLVAALRGLRAQSEGQPTAVRDATLRLVETLSACGEARQARDELATWVSGEPSDREATRLLCDMDALAGNWQLVAEGCERLVRFGAGAERVAAALRLVEACEKAGDVAMARPGLEHAYEQEPDSEALRDRLARLYESIGAKRELGELLQQGIDAVADPTERFGRLRRAGALLLEAEEGELALAPLRAAVAIRGDDFETSLALIDALTAAGIFDEAQQRLDAAVAAQGRRRSPELAALQHRAARLAARQGDVGKQLEWLAAALDMDRTSGEVAADLADLAQELGDTETALKALRAITLLRGPCRISRAQAYLRQAQIAHQQGEGQKALVFARRAKAEDAHSPEVVEFLRQIGEP